MSLFLFNEACKCKQTQTDKWGYWHCSLQRLYTEGQSLFPPAGSGSTSPGWKNTYIKPILQEKPITVLPAPFLFTTNSFIDPVIITLVTSESTWNRLVAHVIDYPWATLRRSLCSYCTLPDDICSPLLYPIASSYCCCAGGRAAGEGDYIDKGVLPVSNGHFQSHPSSSSFVSILWLSLLRQTPTSRLAKTSELSLL